MSSSVVVAILTGLTMGVVFGIALEKSRVFEPGMIVGQMQLRNFIMLKIFLTAVATGAVVLAALNGFGFVKLQPKAALYAADVVGGLLLGAGIALAGACPGTTLAQIGVGYRDAMFTLAGGLFGARCDLVRVEIAQPEVIHQRFLDRLVQDEKGIGLDPAPAKCERLRHMPIDVDGLATLAVAGEIGNVVLTIELLDLAHHGIERAFHHEARYIPLGHP